MKEDLNFKGNELTQINTVFTVGKLWQPYKFGYIITNRKGYVIGQIPSNLALYYIKPRIFFPSMMILWGSLTMITAATHDPQSIMAIRFFQALAESSTFVGTHYILGAWYTERELGKRSGIFTASGLAGTMIGGFLQTGIHSSMDGLQGLAGWRWLFIVDGLICIPVAIYGFLLFPDTPSTTKVPYLSAAERELARSRVPRHVERAPFNWSFVKRVFGSWYFYGFVMLWIIAGETESFSSNSLLALYMKAHPERGYTVSQLNNYPTGVPAVGIVSTIFWATLTDFLGGKRYLVGYWIGVTGIVTSAMILAPTATTASTFAAYYWAGSVYACKFPPSPSTQHTLTRPPHRPSDLFRLGQRRPPLRRRQSARRGDCVHECGQWCRQCLVEHRVLLGGLGAEVHEGYVGDDCVFDCAGRLDGGSDVDVCEDGREEG